MDSDAQWALYASVKFVGRLVAASASLAETIVNENAGLENKLEPVLKGLYAGIATASQLQQPVLQTFAHSLSARQPSGSTVASCGLHGLQSEY